MVKSSAYIRCEIGGLVLDILTPCILPSAFAFVNNLENTLKKIVNKAGERGSPCLIPLLALKCP